MPTTFDRLARFLRAEVRLVPHLLAAHDQDVPLEAWLAALARHPVEQSMYRLLQ